MEINNERDAILYVDDEVENLTVFKFAFRKHYKIFVASSAEEGMEILRHNQIKILITDQRMPEVTGVEFLEKTVNEFPEIIRMIITGFSDIEAIIMAINKGRVYKYITKPWDKEELKMTINNALESFHLKKENKKLIERLQETNRSLEDKVRARTLLIEQQKQEIEKQRDYVVQQRDKIIQQNKELEQHRNHLEELVRKRTADLIEAKNRAEESDRLKTAFLANMSHEIRTPLNAIVGFSDLLAISDFTDEQKAEFAAEISRQSDVLLNMIEEIIDISKIEAGQMQIHFSECNVSTILYEIFNFYQSNNKKLLLRIFLDEEFMPPNINVLTDAYKLRQILNNLLENAIKFTDAGEIHFGCKITERHNTKMLEFYVTDTGIGMASDKLDIIFNLFYKLEDNTTKLYRGTGLGLTIARKLVNLLGGEIGVESELNKGSKFYFYLPYTKSFNVDKETNNGQKIISYDWSDKKIVVAEDEDINYLYIEKILTKTKVSFYWANNGAMALDLINTYKPDLVLLDIKMPEIDGFTVIKKLREKGVDTPVIAQTAYAMSSEIARMLESGCNDVISKPFKAYDLLEKIAKFFT